MSFQPMLKKPLIVRIHLFKVVLTDRLECRKKWKILGQMLKYSVETQIDVIIAAFALHNYILMNSHDDLRFSMVEHNPNYRGDDELPDVHDTDTSNEIPEDRSTTMRDTRNNIAKLIWK
jgi:hypothetical protein